MGSRNRIAVNGGSRFGPVSEFDGQRTVAELPALRVLGHSKLGAERRILVASRVRSLGEKELETTSHVVVRRVLLTFLRKPIPPPSETSGHQQTSNALPKRRSHPADVIDCVAFLRVRSHRAP